MNPFLLPVVATQGAWLRATITVASPAGGATIGRAGNVSDPQMRIAVVGESTAAGCGADTHENAFPGSLARELTMRTHQGVQWEVVGQFGATARRIRYRLLPQLGENLDLAVLLAGVNDVLTRRTPQQWRDDLSAIVDDLAVRAGHVAVTGLPPFASFPSLPTTLGRYLAERASALDEVSQQVCAERPQTTWISATSILPLRPSFFSHDKFHPSPAGYRRWAQAVADHLNGGATLSPSTC